MEGRCALFSQALKNGKEAYQGSFEEFSSVVECLRTLSVRDRMVLMGITMDEVMHLWRTEGIKTIGSNEELGQPTQPHGW